MIVVKGEIKTNQIISCIPNSATRKYDITFDNGSTYSYAMQNVLFMKDPKILKGKLQVEIEQQYNQETLSIV